MMRTWKLVSGILSIILFCLVSMQSCIAGLGNAPSENGEVSGTAGVFVAVMMLAGGIVSIVSRNGGKGLDRALIALYALGAFVGMRSLGNPR